MSAAVTRAKKLEHRTNELTQPAEMGIPGKMWADAGGFEDVGDILREARATKQVDASSPRTAAIDEPARFPRPAEKEKLQRADGPGPWVEGCDRRGHRFRDYVGDEACAGG